MKHKKAQGPRHDQSITDFCVVHRLPGPHRTALVHLSDLSWQATGEMPEVAQKGDEVETVLLAIDVDRERISLGIKQLEGDPFGNYVTVHDKCIVVRGS